METRAAGLLIFRRLSGQIHYLVLKASYGNFHWSPPKGYVDSGENDFATALRETKEETGYIKNELIIYKSNPKELHYEVGGKPKVVKYWLAQLRDICKEPILSKEHTEYKWLLKEEAKEALGHEDIQQMIDEFHVFIINELKLPMYM